MPRSTDARAKALETAERLFRMQGYAATGLTQIIQESNSPKGSFYFHFPGGKDQLAREVIAGYGARGRTLIKTLATATDSDAVSFVIRLCDAFGVEMHQSDYRLGCLVQNIANEHTPVDTPLAEALSLALNSWIEAAEEHFLKCGISTQESRELARALISSLEGARTVAHIQRKIDVFDELARVICRAIKECHRPRPTDTIR